METKTFITNRAFITESLSALTHMQITANEK